MDFGLLPAGRDRLSLATNHRVDSLGAKVVRFAAGWRRWRDADGAPGPYRVAAPDTGERPMKLLLALLAAGGLTAGLLGNLFGNHPYTVTAYFLSAEGLTPQNDVVINGARVGKVSSVAIAPDNGPSQGGAQVVLELEGSAAPLHRGTRATIRPKGLLGNPFVELTAGPPSAATIPSGGTLPLQDTASPVDLDQVMDLFDPQTRARIQTLTREGGAALADRGSDLNLFLQAMPAILQDTSTVTGKIAAQDQQLSALDVEFDRIAQMMAAEDQAFRRDIANGASLLDLTAAHEAQLKAELVYADRALGSLAAGLKGHEGDLNQMLRQLPAVLDALQKLSDHSATSLAILDPCMADIVATLAEMRSATSYRDANGNLLRVHPYVFAGTEPVNPARIACSGGH
ncbi:MAG: MCE family protein [Chloroflexi bacterium]|nr:MAG: MCE family protein [Chloroflexota bacterium]